MLFINRSDAGKRLAKQIQQKHFVSPHLIALPRGGVPVAVEIAQVLHAPLDILVVRKIGAPSNPEFGIGAICENDFVWIDQKSQRTLSVSEKTIHQIVKEQSLEVKRRVQYWRDGRALPSLKEQLIVLVDDGLATGGSALAAAHYLRSRGVSKIVLAVPVASIDGLRDIKGEFDEIVCLETPEPFYSVGLWYQDFKQLDDADVKTMLFEYSAQNLILKHL